MKKHVFLALAVTFTISFSYSQSGRVGIGESNPGSKGSIKGNLSVGSTYSSTSAPTDGAIIEGKTAVGTASPDGSAKLQIDATDAGILIPRMTGAQRDAIASPATGLLVYVTDGTKGFWYYNGTIWAQAIGSKGDTGAAGTNGANGTTGAKGDTGAAGTNGANGTTGAKGDTGAAGTNGANGATGAKGDTGATGFLQNGTAVGQTPYWNGSNWVIDQNIYNNGGNVGIGASPSVKLEVNGDINLNNQALTAANSINRGYYVYKSGTVAYGLKLQYSGTKWGTMMFGPNQADRFLGFGKVGTALEDDDMIEYMRLDLNNGNLGIGTTGPLSKLSVGDVGNANYTGYFKQTAGNSTAAIYADGGTPASAYWAGGINATVISGGGGFAYGIMGSSIGGTSTSGRAYGVYGKAGGGTTGWNYGTTGELLSAAGDGAGIYGVDRNAVGTTSVISGTYAGYFDGKVNVNGNTSLNGSLNVSTLAANSAVYTDASKNLTTTTPASGTLGYWTRSGTNLYNTTLSDNVGIGTTAPQSKTHIFGGNQTSRTFKLDAAPDADGLLIESATTGSKKDAILQFWSKDQAGGTNTWGASRLRSGWELSSSTSWAESYISFQTHGLNSSVFTDDLFIKGGNVGIGTTSPGQKLEVNGNILNRGMLYQYTSLGQGSGAHGISWYQPSYLTWVDYMAPAGGSNAPNGTAAPTDATIGVTSWARRFNIENISGYGWVFESGPNSSTAPTVKFAINSANGSFHSTGNGYIDGLAGTGNRPVYADANGLLKAGSTSTDNSQWSIASNLSSSPDDFTATWTTATDEGQWGATMPFSIRIDGVDYNTLSMTTNGAIIFGSTTATITFSNNCLPTSSVTTPTLFWYWDDMKTSYRWFSQGTSPNRTFVIDFDSNVYNTSDDVDGVVQISENGLIQVSYRVADPNSNGQGATIGFQRAGGSSAIAHSIGCNAKVMDDNRLPEEWSVAPVK